MKTRLPLVRPEEALDSGQTPAFERLVKRARVGSAEHAGAILCVGTLVRSAALTVVPPSAGPSVLAAVDPILSLARTVASGAGEQGRQELENRVRKARGQLFGSIGGVCELSVGAVEKAVQPSGAASEMQQHARHVVLRYVSLAAYFCCSAACHTADGVDDPKLLLEALKDLVGARTYLRVGLGAARHPEFLDRAEAQASFESELATSRRLGHRKDALVLQVFHEYLGSRFRTVARHEQSELDAAIEWALSGQA